MNFHLKGYDLNQSPYRTTEVNFSTDDLQTIVDELERFLKGCGVMKEGSLIIAGNPTTIPYNPVPGPWYSVPTITSDPSVRLLVTNAENSWSL